jgi:hypothetical protein
LPQEKQHILRRAYFPQFSHCAGSLASRSLGRQQGQAHRWDVSPYPINDLLRASESDALPLQCRFILAMNMVAGTSLIATMPKRMAVTYAHNPELKIMKAPNPLGCVLILDGLASTNE